MPNKQENKVPNKMSGTFNLGLSKTFMYGVHHLGTTDLCCCLLICPFSFVFRYGLTMGSSLLTM